MALNILVVPDKFKGTLTAKAVADAIGRGWRRVRPEDAVELLPMSDGGDGFGEVMGRLLQAKVRVVRAVDAAHRPCRTKWWWEPKSKTAIVESANVIGLAMLPAQKFHPFQLDTFGLGAVLRAVSAKGARRCIVGIGGSATNDGGFGLARALGWQFWGSDDKIIECWTDLHIATRVQPPKRRRWFVELTVAVDVQNSLLGPRGATRVYGPQKGLQPFELAEAEANLKRLSSLCRNAGLHKSNHRNAATTPGSGAAGGLGFGLITFAGASLQPGFEMFARYAELTARLRSADVVITGEGRIDRSSFMGKGVGTIAQLCRRLKIPCLAIGGAVDDYARDRRRFTQIRALTDLATVRSAKANPTLWLERLTAKIAANGWISP